MTFESELIKKSDDRKIQRVIGVITDETRTYDSQEEFHAAMFGLSRLYINEIRSPLAHSLLQHACLANAALRLVGLSDYEVENLVPEPSFLAGEMLALHAEISPIDRRRRQQLLNCGIQLVPSGSSADLAYGHIATIFLDAMDDPVSKIRKGVPEAMFKPIVDASLLYDDSTEGTSRDRFVAGFDHSLRSISAVAINAPYQPRYR